MKAAQGFREYIVQKEMDRVKAFHHSPLVLSTGCNASSCRNPSLLRKPATEKPAFGTKAGVFLDWPWRALWLHGVPRYAGHPKKPLWRA